MPGTRLMLCDYVLKERKGERREGRRKKGFPFTPNVRATTLPPINNQQTFVVCGDPRGIRVFPLTVQLERYRSSESKGSELWAPSLLPWIVASPPAHYQLPKYLGVFAL